MSDCEGQRPDSTSQCEGFGCKRIRSKEELSLRGVRSQPLRHGEGGREGEEEKDNECEKGQADSEGQVWKDG